MTIKENEMQRRFKTCQNLNNRSHGGRNRKSRQSHEGFLQIFRGIPCKFLHGAEQDGNASAKSRSRPKERKSL